MAEQIEATLHVTITHRSGPVIADPDHVRRWLCADGRPRGIPNGFLFAACPDHDNPDDCVDCIADVSIYAAAITSADWDEVEQLRDQLGSAVDAVMSSGYERIGIRADLAGLAEWAEAQIEDDTADRQLALEEVIRRLRAMSNGSVPA